MKYKILEHPAELRLRIYGKTVEELFMNAAEALAYIQKKNITLALRSQMQCNKNLRKEIIKVSSIDINSLLVDFLSEILAKSQINKCVYRIAKLKIKDSKLETELAGFPIERFDEDIKAVTYEDLDIKQINGTWQTTIVFDI